LPNRVKPCNTSDKNFIFSLPSIRQKGVPKATPFSRFLPHFTRSKIRKAGSPPPPPLGGRGERTGRAKRQKDRKTKES